MNKLHISTIEDTIEYKFQNVTLLEQAYTFRSFAQEHSDVCSNDLLPIIGNAAIYRFITRFAIAEFMRITPAGLRAKKAEESISKWRASLISKSYLASRLDILGIASSKYLRIGKDDTKGKNYDQDNFKATLFEAIIGAVAVDCNFDTEVLDNCIYTILRPEPGEQLDTSCFNFIGQVQYWLTEHKLAQPVYIFEELDGGFKCKATIPEYYHKLPVYGGIISEPTFRPYRGLTNFESFDEDRHKSQQKVAEEIWRYISIREAQFLAEIAREDRGATHTSEAGISELRRIVKYIIARLAILENDKCYSSINILQELFQHKWTTLPEFVISDISDGTGPNWQTYVSIKIIPIDREYRAISFNRRKADAKKIVSRVLLDKIISISNMYS
ncbi:MAG: hypothetical protein LBE09_00195 [Christensenellaceae bacterium]|jgi:dsRNA-specific ribonuclease|nr:hypothetical protein [Christensenellaceae bacterium]